MKLTLTREQRARLFDGDCPAITGFGKCQVSKGYVYKLSSRLSLKVLRVDHGNAIKDGKAVITWRIHYQLDDRRDPVRLIRRTPTISSGDFDRMRRDRDEHGFPHVVPDGEAADESAYTSGGASALVDAGEAPPRGWVEERAKQHRLRDLKGLEDPRREANRLRDAAGRAKARGVDYSDNLANIRREIDGILAKLEEAA